MKLEITLRLSDTDRALLRDFLSLREQGTTGVTLTTDTPATLAELVDVDVYHRELEEQAKLGVPRDPRYSYSPAYSWLGDRAKRGR